jgi:DUF4097 and DUF4098 domain-containing protein YvlB
MKKILVISVAAGVALTAATLSILHINGVDWWGDMRQTSQHNLQTHSKTVAAIDVNKITVDSANSKIKVVPADGDQITVDYFSTDNINFAIDVAGGELTVKQQEHVPSAFWDFGLDGIWGLPTITLHVPADSQMAYEMRASNGRVDVADVAADRMRIEGSNTEVSLNHLRVKNNVTVSSSNAKITFDDLAADDIRLDTSNANIKGRIAGRFDDYRKDLQTSSYMSITVDGTEYNHHLKSERGDKRLEVGTNNGDIEIDFAEL